MAVVRRIALVTIVLLATIAVYWMISSYVNGDAVVCYPTVQRRILEVVDPYVYGLLCGFESDPVNEDNVDGIMAWIWKMILKWWWGLLMTSQNELYVCELDWALVINIRFSLAANRCTVAGEDVFWMLFYDYCPIMALPIMVMACLIMCYCFCCKRKYIYEVCAFYYEGPDDKPKDGDGEDRDKPTKKNKSGSADKVPKKISYKLIKEVYQRKPASKGIADALPENQKVVCRRKLEIKDLLQQLGLVGILSSVLMDESPPKKRQSLVVKGRVEPKRKKKTKEVLNWVLSKDIRYVTELADYTIVKVLGHGSFGSTYLAKVTDRFFLSKKLPPVPRKEDYVAVKVVNKEFLNRHRVSHNWKQTAVNELKIMEVSMCCPFLMYVTMAFQTCDYLVYVMPLMFGSLLDYKVPFSERRLVLLAAEILNGLTHLHSLGFIHRDLKLDNILIDECGHLKISDFGCSRENVYGKKKCYGIIGNQRCQAPEVLQGSPYNESSDFWSFGVLMYLLIEDTYPFRETKNRTRNYAMFVKHLLFQRANGEEMQFICNLFHHDPDQRLGSPSSQYGDIYAHDYFSGIDYAKLWAGQYEPPCPNMVSPVGAKNGGSQLGSQSRGIPVRPDTDILPEDLLIYADFPVIST